MTVLLEKRCSKCGIVKSVAQYRRDKKAKDGWRSQCKECDKKYNQANPITIQTAHMVKKARQRAKDKELAFDIDNNFIRSIIPSHCPIFGTRLEWSCNRGGTAHPLPSSPSLDRIDPSRGYVKGNVWIISNRANTIKNNASHEELKLVTEAVGRAIVNSLDW
jgi:hypothetical protein